LFSCHCERPKGAWQSRGSEPEANDPRFSHCVILGLDPRIQTIPCVIPAKAGIQYLFSVLL